MIDHEVLEQAARLLYKVAGGQAQRKFYIKMVAGNAPGKKYITVHAPLTVADCRAHLLGQKTIGASLDSGDQTLMLLFDADNSEHFEIIKNAARLLYDSGLVAIVQHSLQADRGGHLVILFGDLVDSDGAYRAVCAVAPELKIIPEYFPRRNPLGQWGKYRVRLPGGRYRWIKPDGKLTGYWVYGEDAQGETLYTGGLEAARAFLSCLNYAQWVDAYDPGPVPQVAQDATPAQLPPAKVPSSSLPNPVNLSSRSTGPARPAHGMYSAAPSVKEVAAWFNDRHDVKSVAIAGGVYDHAIGLARAKWRNDVTPNVRLYEASNTWSDFSSKATKRGGDCFDLAALLSGNVATFRASQTGAFCSWAHSELVTAGRERRRPDSLAWQVSTERGRAIYRQHYEQAITRAG